MRNTKTKRAASDIRILQILVRRSTLKKLLSIFLCICILGSGAAGCGSSKDNTGSTKQAETKESAVKESAGKESAGKESAANESSENTALKIAINLICLVTL